MTVRPPKSPSPRTLGPVADLEHHLPSDWWRSIFGPVYLKTDGDVVEDGSTTQVEVDEIVQILGLTPADHVLDLCCGQGRHTLELARRGFASVSGIDRSRYLIRLARRRAKKEGLCVRFHEGDARRVGARKEHFDAVLILGNSFGYFDRVDDDLAVLVGARRVLEPNGKLLLDITDGHWMRSGFEPRSWEWIDANQFVCRERSLSNDSQRLISREVVVHAERGVIVDQFYAERLYEPEELVALLERAGFKDIVVHESFRTESSRNQDLGMMGQRVRITARAPKPAIVSAPRHDIIPISVLLGDPRRPDTVKLAGSFSKEDLETVARLKEALSRIPGYEFTFDDDHETWFGRFPNKPPAFVFNLCDEGFHNRAEMELHVAAFLEMCGVAYSGGSPQCLALCFDKEIVRSIATQFDIPVPVETSANPGDNAATIPAVFPALLKPARGDSSVGITAESVVYDPVEAVDAFSRLAKEFPTVPILVQEYLTGPEYSVGIIGNPGLGYRVLPILEVNYDDLPEGLPRILGYESKWDPDSPYWDRIHYQKLENPDERHTDMVSHAIRLFERLGCRDYARFDFRADSNGTIKFLEANPNPGWCWDGKLNLMAEMEGASYSELLQWIIEAALHRIRANSENPSAALDWLSSRPELGPGSSGQ